MLPQYDNELHIEAERYLGFSDRRQVGDGVWTLFLVFLIGLILLSMFGCVQMPHKIEHHQIAGRVVEVHTDAPSHLEPKCSEPWAGCYVIADHKVFLRSPVSRGARKHELGHAAGMRHTAWVHHEFLNWKCAAVIASGGGYEVGQVICNRSDGEQVFTDATLSTVAA